jgi:hypothetical protein
MGGHGRQGSRRLATVDMFPAVINGARAKSWPGRALLGTRMYGLVSAVCGEGYALHEVVGDGKRERLTAADMLRMGLDDLAELWRLAMRP